MIAAGILDKRVAIAPVTRGKDALGGVTETVGQAVSVWARVEPIDPQERFEKERFELRPELRVTIRWRAGVNHRDRLTYRGRAYDILGAHDPDDRREVLKLYIAAREAGA